MTYSLSHIFRRLIHVNMIWIPYLYYFYFSHGFLGFSRNFWACLVGLILLGFESIRLSESWIFFGQRPYERKKSQQ